MDNIPAINPNMADIFLNITFPLLSEIMHSIKNGWQKKFPMFKKMARTLRQLWQEK